MLTAKQLRNKQDFYIISSISKEFQQFEVEFGALEKSRSEAQLYWIEEIFPNAKRATRYSVVDSFQKLESYSTAFFQNYP